MVSEEEEPEVKTAAPENAGKGEVTEPSSPESSAETKPPRKKGSGIIRFLRSILDGTILTKEKMIKTLPFLLFLTLLGIMYIANTYYAEKTMRAIEKTQKELKELRYEHITTKSELMFMSKQSEVLKRLEGSGLKESRTPPEKITIEKPVNTGSDKNNGNNQKKP